MKIITAVLASTLLIGGAYAQAATQADGANSTATSAKHDAGVDAHIKDLHAKLKISADEESLWATVAKAMHENAREIDTAVDKRESLMKNASAVDDLNAYGDIAQAHADAVKKLAAAFAPLYSSMSDAQKKIADDVFMQRGKTSVQAMK